MPLSRGRRRDFRASTRSGSARILQLEIISRAIFYLIFTYKDTKFIFHETITKMHSRFVSFFYHVIILIFAFLFVLAFPVVNLFTNRSNFIVRPIQSSRTRISSRRIPCLEN